MSIAITDPITDPLPKPISAASKKFRLTTPAIYVLLIAYLLIVVYPLFWLVCTSVKPDQQIYLHPFQLPDMHALDWSNFTHAWVGGHFGNFFFNSVVITVVTVVITVFLSAMAGYALARFSFLGSKAWFFYFLAGLMIPIQLTIVPLFFQLKSWHLLNSRIGLSLAYIGFGFPFSIFILAGFFRSLPRALHESAQIDGSSEFRTFWSIMLPLSRPGLITVSIFLFLGNWNEFLVAFMCLSGKTSESLRTLPLGVAALTIASQYRSDWGMAFAGLVLMMLPTLIVYAALQQHLTKGITAGAVKG
jgi:ABC-type glycerol-3-phosphate transport system permease component